MERCLCAGKKGIKVNSCKNGEILYEFLFCILLVNPGVQIYILLPQVVYLEMFMWMAKMIVLL